MYVSDYGFAAAPSAWRGSGVTYSSFTAINWMYMGLTELTITRVANGNNYGYIIYESGTYSHGGYVTWDYAIRPAFNLVPSTTYVRGTGTMSDPIIIN